MLKFIYEQLIAMFFREYFSLSASIEIGDQRFSKPIAAVLQQNGVQICRFMVQKHSSHDIIYFNSLYCVTIDTLSFVSVSDKRHLQSPYALPSCQFWFFSIYDSSHNANCWYSHATSCCWCSCL